MRLVALVVCAAAMLAVPASAAEIDPKALVLQQAEVPAEFRLDRSQSGVVTNRELRDAGFVARSGRITGYVAQYEQRGRDRGVQSGADLFRRPAGALMMLAQAHDVWRTQGEKDRLSRAGIGTESWVYAGSIDTVIFWRYGRVFGSVLGVEMSKTQTLELARVQQRRIARALR